VCVCTLRDWRLHNTSRKTGETYGFPCNNNNNNRLHCYSDGIRLPTAVKQRFVGSVIRRQRPERIPVQSYYSTRAATFIHIHVQYSVPITLQRMMNTVIDFVTVIDYYYYYYYYWHDAHERTLDSSKYNIYIYIYTFVDRSHR